ncbi:MAG: hypothetical protein JNK14_05800 [Chitinophagaceae bacterium]|nr:hypothetical protein [Chitinophagaceae bacterium]
MALTNTQLNDAIILVGDSDMGKQENRLSSYGALQAFVDEAPNLLPKSAVESIKKSARHPEKVPVLSKFTSSLIEAPSCTITGNRATSAFKTLTWAALGFEATIIPSVNQDNYIAQTEDLAHQIKMGMKTVLSTLDSRCVTALETNKSTDIAAAKNAVAGAGYYSYRKEAKNFFRDAPAVMQLNDLEGPYIDIANTESRSTILDIQTQALYNQINLAGTLGTLGNAANWAHYSSNRVDAGQHDELHYLTPKGTIGIYNWVDMDSQIGRMAGAKKWYQVQDPIKGFNWGVFQIDDCADQSSELSLNTRAYTEKYQFVAYFAIVTDYASTTNTPIIKFWLDEAASIS